MASPTPAARCSTRSPQQSPLPTLTARRRLESLSIALTPLHIGPPAQTYDTTPDATPASDITINDSDCPTNITPPNTQTRDSFSKTPSWAELDLVHRTNDIHIYKTTEHERVRRLTLDQQEQEPSMLRQLGVPVKLDLHLKILINSQPLFNADMDLESNTVRPRRFVLQSYKHTTYQALVEVVHASCEEMWDSARAAVGQVGAKTCDTDRGVNSDLIGKTDGGEISWRGSPTLPLGSERAMLKLEEDGTVAELTVGRTIIAGNDLTEHKHLRYREWYHRNVENGVLAAYTVEFTIDMVTKSRR